MRILDEATPWVVSPAGSGGLWRYHIPRTVEAGTFRSVVMPHDRKDLA